MKQIIILQLLKLKESLYSFVMETFSLKNAVLVDNYNSCINIYKIYPKLTQEMNYIYC